MSLAAGYANQRVYMVYPETRNEESYEPILSGLRRRASKFG